jgi:enhancing lycopene biosynthesis protein 2
MKKKVAVILAGCGVYDGSEIHEAVLTLFFLDRVGVDVACFAPDKPQMHVINHLTGAPASDQTRNVLAESARIARGKVAPLTDLHASEWDAVVIPGGFGAAKNLCNFAVQGAGFTVDPDLAAVIRSFHHAKKPIGILCIAPVIVAKVLGATVTIGCDSSVAEAIVHSGGQHVTCRVGDIAIDEINNVVSAPAYMYDATISEVAEGIEKLVCEVVDRVS